MISREIGGLHGEDVRAQRQANAGKMERAAGVAIEDEIADRLDGRRATARAREPDVGGAGTHDLLEINRVANRIGRAVGQIGQCFGKDAAVIG